MCEDVVTPAVRHNLAKTAMAATLKEEPVGGEHPFFVPDWCPGPLVSEAVHKWISVTAAFCMLNHSGVIGASKGMMACPTSAPISVQSSCSCLYIT